MIWSKLDFEREVRRQLVELESIRKRVPAGSEVQERIDRLEVSHKNILRKIEEVFPVSAGTPEADPAQCGTPGESSGAHADASSAPVSASFESHLRAVVQSIQDDALTGTFGRSSPALQLESPPAPSTTGEQLPGLDTRCARCGRILLTSLLGGEEVIRFESEWWHRECVSSGESFAKPGTLN